MWFDYRIDAENVNVDVPFWFLTLLFSIYPLWALRTYLRARRQNKNGLCSHCGYDLRATPERCPECGAIPTSVDYNPSK